MIKLTFHNMTKLTFSRMTIQYEKELKKEKIRIIKELLIIH